jgi:hypothetical protein
MAEAHRSGETMRFSRRTSEELPSMSAGLADCNDG